MNRMICNSHLFAIGITVIGLFVATPPRPSWSHSKGIYATQAEAEVRAQEIGCTTVHQNNGKWMPCADERELHRQLRKQ